MARRNKLETERAEKMLVVSSHAKLKRNQLRSVDDLDQEFDLTDLRFAILSGFWTTGGTLMTCHHTI